MRAPTLNLPYSKFRVLVNKLPAPSRKNVEDFEKESFFHCIQSVSREPSLLSHKKFTFSNDNEAPVPPSSNPQTQKKLNFNRLPLKNGFANCRTATFSANGQCKRKKFEFGDPVADVCRVLAIIFRNKVPGKEEDTLEAFKQKLVNVVVYKVIDKVSTKLAKSTKIRNIKALEEIKERKSNGDLLWLLKEVVNSRHVLVRRKEEKLKFVMKNTIKHFRKLYFKNNGLKACKDSELEFLEYYFKEHKEKYGVGVENFSDPLKTSTVINPQHKTLSSGYFKLLFGVERFRKLFFSYLDFQFKANYQMNVEKKFGKMFKRLVVKLDMGLFCDRKAIFERYTEELKEAKCSKLPWFDNEIDNAIEVFKTHVEKSTKT